MLYRVIVKLKNGDTVHCRLPNKSSATVMYKACREFLDDPLIEGVHIVNVSKPSPRDENLSRPPGSYWCPYCAAYRKFLTWNSYKKCHICGMSNEDFYFKKYNQFFVREFKKTRRKRKNKK